MCECRWLLEWGTRKGVDKTCSFVQHIPNLLEKNSQVSSLVVRNAVTLFTVWHVCCSNLFCHISLSHISAVEDTSSQRQWMKTRNLYSQEAFPFLSLSDVTSSVMCECATVGRHAHTKEPGWKQKGKPGSAQCCQASGGFHHSGL